MIRAKKYEKYLQLSQQLRSPSVYLDHWAVREISESEELASRFVQIIKRQKGTWAISWLNALEFSRVSDPVQRQKADSMLNKAYPDLFWLKTDFFEVSSIEQKNNSPLAASDEQMAKGYVSMVPRTPFASIHTWPEIQPQFEHLGNFIISKIERFRTEVARDPYLHKSVKASPSWRKGRRGTVLIGRELVGHIVNHPQMQLSPNDAIDLSHAVVALSYCDYVLLDRRWVAMANEVRKRLEDACLSVPMAKVYSKASNGIDTFLTDFANFRQ